MASDPVVEVTGLEARYGESPVLESVDFRVRRGEIFGIVGGSGSGKSTLLRLLVGLLRPTAGRIVVDGLEVSSADEDAITALRRRIGVTFQHGAMFSSLTVGENVALPLQEHTDLTPALVEAVVRLKLDLVNLRGAEDLAISELSGGMLKRAALARAMALDPSILFFDEPSAGLDPVKAAGLDRLLLQLNESLGTTIVVVTHDLASILAITDRVIMLDGAARGIVAEGAPDALRESDDPRVHAFFHREAAPRGP
jgi:phospholipid/cholesterol/gamma-HCH transport system ATP-binding protein